jgi:ribonuclease HIII
MAELSDRSGIVLVKGASDRVVAAGRAFVAKNGRERLGEVAKLHFKTAMEVLAP